MTSVPWIRLYTSWPRHRKTIILRRILGTAEPIIALWCWASENAPDGDLTGFTAREIEKAADWDGEPGRCLAALVESGFVDVSTNSGYKIHEWEDGAGAGIASYRRRTEKQRKLMRDRRASGSGSGSDQEEEEEEEDSRANVGANVSANKDANVLLFADEQSAKEPPLLSFPCAKGETWHLTESIRSDLSQAFPGIDVLAVARRALEWCKANPRKVKTSGRMRSWLGNTWCAREQDRPAPQQRVAQQQRATYEVLR